MKKENILNLLLIVIIGVMVVVGTVQAATTISTNIVTEGTLAVTGTTTLMGNVGIGTTTPNATLGMQGSIGISPTQIYLSSNGSVQIGTSTPDGDFTVAGASASVFNTNRSFGNGLALAARLVALSSTDDVVPGFGVSLGFSLEDSAGTRMNNTGAIANVWENATSPTRTASLVFGTLTSGAGAQTEKMRLTGAGFVGIGTTTPTTQLQVTASASNATTTLTIGKVGQNKGTCHEEFRSDGAVIYWWWTPAGAMATSTSSCK